MGQQIYEIFENLQLASIAAVTMLRPNLFPHQQQRREMPLEALEISRML
jgi:hypothetical protein